MTVEKAINILSEYCCSGLDTTMVTFDATPDEFEEALDKALFALRTKNGIQEESSMLKEIVDLQKRYKELFKAKRLTKKAICDLGIPFRNKYNLGDLETLRIMRGELSLEEIWKFISLHNQ